MALDDFIQTNEKNLKVSKDSNRKFLFDFRINGKRYRKVVELEKREGWTKREYVSEAKGKLLDFIKSVKEGGITSDTGLKPTSKLNELITSYLDTLKDTEWKRTKQSFYERYVAPSLGAMRLEQIREAHISKLITKLEREGMKPRTVRTTLEILKPGFDFAKRNRTIDTNPCEFLTVKVDKHAQKKVVLNAGETFKRIYLGINDYFKDDPFWRAFFLFGFTGRRKGEILKLSWENIDLQHDVYWIEDPKAKEAQRYPLFPFVKEALLQIPSDRKGLVFKSPKTGTVLKNTDRQMWNFRDQLQMPELTLHYMRNILVSMLHEQGLETSYLSGVLGHKDATTINKYLSINTHRSSEEGYKKIGPVLNGTIS